MAKISIEINNDLYFSQIWQGDTLAQMELDCLHFVTEHMAVTSML